MTNNELETLATTVAQKLSNQSNAWQTPKEWLTPIDLQNEFDIKTARQGNLRSEGLIPFHKRGRYIRYKRSDINNWFETAKVV